MTGQSYPRLQTTYAYDADDQLLSINGGGSSERHDSRPQSFTYDGNGKLLQQQIGEDDQNQRFTYEVRYVNRRLMEVSS